MKIAITGKGGVGKTTFSSMLSRMFADDGYRVVAVDADPDANLGLALGFPKEVYDSIVPISEMRKLISERTAAETGTFNKMFKLNPKVDDIPENYCKEYNGVRYCRFWWFRMCLSRTCIIKKTLLASNITK